MRPAEPLPDLTADCVHALRKDGRASGPPPSVLRGVNSSTSAKAIWFDVASLDEVGWERDPSAGSDRQASAFNGRGA